MYETMPITCKLILWTRDVRPGQNNEATGVCAKQKALFSPEFSGPKWAISF